MRKMSVFQRKMEILLRLLFCDLSFKKESCLCETASDIRVINSLTAVIRSFFCNHNIMRMTFCHRSGGDANELSIVVQGFNIF